MLQNIKIPEIITVLTGCVAQDSKTKLLKNDFIDYVIGNDEKLHIYDYINSENHLHHKDIMVQSEFNKVELIDTTKNTCQS